MAKISRRAFIKYLAGLSLFSLLGGFMGRKFNEILNSFSNESSELLYPYPPPVKGANFAMMIDIGACIGCRRCLWGCKLENNVPDEPSYIEWIDLFEMENTRPVTEVDRIPPKGSNQRYTESPKKGFWYLSFNCFHCDNPPCTKVCPTGATYKDEDGLVLVDYEKCIGCRYCMSACPYNARRFNWWEPEHPPVRVNPIDGSVEPLNPKVPLRPRGNVEKCTFCVHRIRNGNPVPRCVEVCPTRARHFGDLNDPDSEVSNILKTLRTHRIREDLNTGPMLFYFTRGVKWTREGERL